MKATIPQFRFNGVVFISLAASVLVFLGSNAPKKIVSAVSLPATTIATTSEFVPQQSLPFGFDDVVRYFEDALGYRAQESFVNQVVFHGGNSPADYTITVTRRGPDVLVKFNVVDDYGMNLVREFFEAPFFLRFESEQFYTLLNGRNVARTLHMPRFTVFFEYNCPDFAADIIMNFSPRMRSRSAPDEATTP